MPFTLVCQDITTMRVDAIVNAANTGLQMGGGVCGAIFRAAGPEEMQAACDLVAPIRPGTAVATPGFGLPAKHVIHTPGPVWSGGKSGEEAVLTACYTNALTLALKLGCESIAFPLISSGVYGYPHAEALRVATQAIRAFLETREMEVSLVVLTEKMVEVDGALMASVDAFLEKRLAEGDAGAGEFGGTSPAQAGEAHETLGSYDLFEEPSAPQALTPEPTAGADKRSPDRGPGFLFRKKARKAGEAVAVEAATVLPAVPQMENRNLDQWIETLDEPFSQTLLRLIDAKGLSDVTVYKRANLDRKHFSKIRSNRAYAPGRRTVLALSVALELSLPETADLMRRAGFALSRSRKDDVIVEYFLTNRIYDIYAINEVLFRHDQQLLGG